MKKIILGLLVLLIGVTTVIRAFAKVTLIAMPITLILQLILLVLIIPFNLAKGIFDGSFKFVGIIFLFLIFASMFCGILFINFVARASIAGIQHETLDVTNKMQKWIRPFESDEFLTISSIVLGLLALVLAFKKYYGQLTFHWFMYEGGIYTSFPLGFFITAYLINRGVLKKLRNLVK